jgi:DNA-binding LacI/PurR family transcriptional regulator
MTTIKDIAKHSKVSLGTVSNFLNNPDLLSDETYRQIQKTIDKLGYHPSAAARSLKMNQTKRIGIIPLISVEENIHSQSPDTAFYNLVSAINTAASQNGFGLLLQAATNKDDEINIYQRLIGEKQVDGIILMGITCEDRRVRLLMEKKYPFIAFGRMLSEEGYSFIDTNGEKGIFNAVEHLAKLGHKKIAFIKPPAELTFSTHRWKGYISGMKAFNLEIRPEFVIEGKFSEQSGQEIMDHLMSGIDQPTAIIAPNDFSAYGMLNWASHSGMIVGKNISIIGFDDLSLSAHWQPSLTTLSQPLFQIGIQLTEILLKLINGDTERHQILVDPQLMIRQSTGKAG